MMVLLRWRDRRDAEPGEVTVDSLHSDVQSVRARLRGIQKANSGYGFRPSVIDTDFDVTIGNTWEIGPTEDEGFFGSKPMRFRLVEPHYPRTP